MLYITLTQSDDMNQPYIVIFEKWENKGFPRSHHDFEALYLSERYTLNMAALYASELARILDAVYCGFKPMRDGNIGKTYPLKIFEDQRE